MKEVLKAGVRGGAIGFSTNQNPVHMYADGTPIQSRFATDEEIVELACALGEINQGAVQISRGSLGVSVPMRESVKLFEEISSRSGRPVIWQSITHRWDKPNEWRQLLDMAKETIDRGVQSYPLCNARLFNNRLTMKNATPIKSPMIAITIINSIRLKPRWSLIRFLILIIKMVYLFKLCSRRSLA